MAAGCFIFLAGKFSFTLMLQLLAIFPVLLGTILLLAGKDFFKALLLPVGYLIFSTGFFERLFGGVVNQLELITAWLATLFFKVIGFPVLLEANVIHLPHISLEVARVCSGVNHIVALLALAVPLGYLTQKTWVKKIIFVFLALFVGIFVNGLRVALIGIYALYNKGADLHGPRETLYVSFVFFFGMIVLILFSKVLSWKDRKDTPTSDSDTPAASTALSQADEDLEVGKKRKPFLVAVIIFSVTLGFMHFYPLKSVELSRPLNFFPTEIAGFIGKNRAYLDGRLRPFSADTELIREYANDQGNKLLLYIGYFARQENSRRIIDYRRTFTHEQAFKVAVPKGNSSFGIKRTELHGQPTLSAVYFWYQIGPRIVTNEYTGRFFTFIDSFLNRKNNGAVIVIQTGNDEKEVMPFLEKAVPLIQTLLSGEALDGE